MTHTHRSIFLKDVKESFPEIRDILNSEHGLIHCEMLAFLYFVRTQIEENKVKEVTRAFQIIEHHFKNGNSALVNAIAVSFLEHLDLGIAKGNISWAYEKLPSSLREPYEELRKYHGI